MRSLMIAVALSGIANAHPGHNSNSHLTIVRPTHLAHVYDDDNVPHQEALFGIPTYGEEIIGKVIYASPGKDNKGCDQYSTAESTVWHTYGDFILLVDRGGCNFVKKVRNAEDAGAAGVIVVDNQCLAADPYGYCDDYSKPSNSQDSTNPGVCDDDSDAYAFSCSEGSEALLPFMADDGSGGNIRIPSFFMSQYHGRNIKSALCSLSDKSKCDDDNNNYSESLVVSMSWDIPADGDSVTWELWTSSEDWFGSEFKREFARVATQLKDATVFEPHYFIYDGIHEWGCQDDAGSNACTDLCTNDGRYCALSPEGDNFSKLDGTDVVKENLRQICVWKYADELNRPSIWWNYINDFADVCFGEEGVEDTESFEKCSVDVQKLQGIDTEKIEKCINDSGGFKAGRNTYLEAELDERKNLYILTLPSMVINGALLRQSTTYGPVLTAICQAFLDGTEPEVCDEVLDPSGLHEGDRYVSIEFLVEGLTYNEFSWQVQSEFRSQIAFKAGVAKSAVEIEHVTKHVGLDKILAVTVYIHSLTKDEANEVMTKIQFAADDNDIQFHTAQVADAGEKSVLVTVALDKNGMFIEIEQGAIHAHKGSSGTKAGVTFMLVVLSFCVLFLGCALTVVWRRVGLTIGDLNIFSSMVVAVPHRFQNRRRSSSERPQVAVSGLSRPLAEGDYTPMPLNDNQPMAMAAASEVQGSAVVVSDPDAGVAL